MKPRAKCGRYGQKQGMVSPRHHLNNEQAGEPNKEHQGLGKAYLVPSCARDLNGQDNALEFKFQAHSSRIIMEDMLRMMIRLRT